MKPCQVDWQKLVITEILFCYREIELINEIYFCLKITSVMLHVVSCHTCFYLYNTYSNSNLKFFRKYDMYMLCESMVMYQCICVFVNDYHISYCSILYDYHI